MLFQLVTMLSTLPEKLIEDLRPSLVPFVKMKRPLTCTLLHIACLNADVSLSTIPFLLKSGADPNAGDLNGDGPLHFLLTSLQHDKDDYAIVRLLLEEGAHLDQVNNFGETAVDCWKKRKDWMNYCRLG